MDDTPSGLIEKGDMWSDCMACNPKPSTLSPVDLEAAVAIVYVPGNLRGMGHVVIMRRLWQGLHADDKRSL